MRPRLVGSDKGTTVGPAEALRLSSLSLSLSSFRFRLSKYQIDLSLEFHPLSIPEAHAAAASFAFLVGAG